MEIRWKLDGKNKIEEKNILTHDGQWAEQWKRIVSTSIHLEKVYTGALFQWFQVFCFRIISDFDVIAHHA